MAANLCKMVVGCGDEWLGCPGLKLMCGQQAFCCDSGGQELGLKGCKQHMASCLPCWRPQGQAAGFRLLEVVVEVVVV